MNSLLADLISNRQKIHVWIAPLTRSIDEIAEFKNTLTNDELKKEKSFHFERDRTQYIAGRGLTRRVLGNYLGIEAGQIKFNYGQNGKPFLAEKLNKSCIQFNLSHSNDIITIAVTIDKKIGADVEYIRPITELNSIVSLYFSDLDNKWFTNIPEDRRTDIFYTLWTRKEAYLKAIGQGLTQSLNFSVLAHDFKKNGGILENELAVVSGWTFFSFKPSKDYQISIAVQEKDCLANIKYQFVLFNHS